MQARSIVAELSAEQRLLHIPVHEDESFSGTLLILVDTGQATIFAGRFGISVTRAGLEAPSAVIDSSRYSSPVSGLDFELLIDGLSYPTIAGVDVYSTGIPSGAEVDIAFFKDERGFMGATKSDPEKIVLTNRQIRDAYSGAMNLTEGEIPYRGAMALRRIARALEGQASDVADAEKRLMREYAKVKDGKRLVTMTSAVIDADRMEEYEAKHKELMGEKHEFSVKPVKLSWLFDVERNRSEQEVSKVNAKALTFLGPLLEEDVEL